MTRNIVQFATTSSRQLAGVFTTLLAHATQLFTIFVKSTIRYRQRLANTNVYSLGLLERLSAVRCSLPQLLTGKRSAAQPKLF